VPIQELLHKFGGEHVNEDVATGRRRFRVTRLPQYLAMSVSRFTKNRFFVEKNPTIVNFPVKNLDMNPYVVADTADGADGVPRGHSHKARRLKEKQMRMYNLAASVSHVGDKRPDGAYKAYVQRAAEKTWYEVQDLIISETVPEAVAISEAYLQVYERAV
jgi:U4/U6.U5 tri-snRNP-associated protein 2